MRARSDQTDDQERQLGQHIWIWILDPRDRVFDRISIDTQIFLNLFYKRWKNSTHQRGLNVLHNVSLDLLFISDLAITSLDPTLRPTQPHVIVLLCWQRHYRMQN